MLHSCGRPMVATDVARKEQPHNGCIPAWLCAECGQWVPRQEDAFLEESLEATTMHEPPAYPAEKLEWHDLLRGIGNVD